MHSKLPTKEIVLLGVGHTNAHVLRMWRMRPIEGARLTCISDFPVATYSGMLPGVLAGQYPPERMEIDLVRLCAAARARLIVGGVVGLDLPSRELLFEDRSPVPFDVLSIGIGSISKTDGVQSDEGALVPVKPMQTFLSRLTQRIQAWRERRATERLRIVIVGGGAGGAEIAFCLGNFVQRTLQDAPFTVTLVHSGDSLVPGSRAKTSLLVEKELERRGIQHHLRRAVTRVAADHVVLDGETPLGADVVIWATGAAAPALLSKLHLPTDDAGFLLTRDTLQTSADAPIFAVGDSGTRMADPTPKAGVYAVRQGPVLWQNIRRLLAGRSLRPYVPQQNFLKLLNTGDGRAIAEYKEFSGSGRWAWKLKDRIDGRFMDKYQDYTPMPMSEAAGRPPKSDKGRPVMKCSGCGCKVGAGVLASVLRRLDIPDDDRVQVGLSSPDDAAVLRTQGSTVVTTDFFTAPLDDGFLVGRIAALNAASDAFAMGARPVAALAMVMLPEGGTHQQEQLLYESLLGALAELRPMGATLVGGHTIEGSQWAIGFTMVAELMRDEVLAKSGLQPGDELILTKPLGTGVLLAAHGHANCPARAMTALRESMLQSNEPAARLAVEMDVRGVTDVTGFGLAGHLLEMLAASNVAAEIELSAIPLLPGAAERLSEGLESTLAPANRAGESQIAVADALRRTAHHAALFDPQTSGGLLIGIREGQADRYLRRLADEQSLPAAVVGRIVPRDMQASPIRLV